MPKVKISTFEESEFKDAFENENDFSDWLRDELESLSDVTGLIFEDAQREVYTGEKRADIIAKISGDEEGSVAIIENQIGKSNHKHLGQLITYGAFTKAKVAIWIANEFEKDHLRALDWLNDNTSEERQFYAIKFTILDFKDNEKKIHFEALVKPDETIELYRLKKTGNLLPRHQARLELFKKAIMEYEKISNISINKKPTHNPTITVRRTRKFKIYWTHARKSGNYITVDILMRENTQEDRKKLFEKLKSRKEEFEKIFGDEKVLWWDPIVEGKKSRKHYYVYVEKELSDLLENIKEDELNQVAKWIAESQKKLDEILLKFE